VSAIAQQADRRAPDRAGITPADKRLTLAAATLGSFVALLDSTVVSIALPAISSDLGGGLESQQWIVNAYLLMLGSLILIGGSLGDIFGERRLFVLGAAGFGVVSAGCALAPSVGTLIVARGLQACSARCSRRCRWRASSPPSRRPSAGGRSVPGRRTAGSPRSLAPWSAVGWSTL
jgi:hypothetical protein